MLLSRGFPELLLRACLTERGIRFSSRGQEWGYRSQFKAVMAGEMWKRDRGAVGSGFGKVSGRGSGKTCP